MRRPVSADGYQLGPVGAPSQLTKANAELPWRHTSITAARPSDTRSSDGEREQDNHNVAHFKYLDCVTEPPREPTPSNVPRITLKKGDTNNAGRPFDADLAGILGSIPSLATRSQTNDREFLASLRSSPGAAVARRVAVLTMACALGVNASALAVLRAFLFSGLGARTRSLRERCSNKGPAGSRPVVFFDAYPNYQLLRDTKKSFDEVACRPSKRRELSQGTVCVLSASNARVVGELFKTTRCPPIIGRPFTAESRTGPRPAPVIIITTPFGRARFSRDSAVVGRGHDDRWSLDDHQWRHAVRSVPTGPTDVGSR